jgi:hypothetical protein
MVVVLSLVSGDRISAVTKTKIAGCVPKLPGLREARNAPETADFGPQRD